MSTWVIGKRLNYVEGPLKKLTKPKKKKFKLSKKKKLLLNVPKYKKQKS